MQEEGGFSRHFRNWARNARSQFNGGKNSGGTWDPHTKSYSTPEQNQNSKNAYQDVELER